MSDYKKYIVPLLKGEPIKEYTKFENKIKRLIKKSFSTYFSSEVERLFKKYYGDTYLDDLFQEFVLRLIQTKDLLLHLDYISERYLVKIIENLIYRQLSCNFKYSPKELSFESVIGGEIEEEVIASEIFPSYTYDCIKELKIGHWMKLLITKLKEPEQEVLCYYLYKRLLNREVKTQLPLSTLYKRWERLKKKIRKLIGSDLEGEDWEELKEFFELYMSKVCEKRLYKKLGN